MKKPSSTRKHRHPPLQLAVFNSMGATQQTTASASPQFTNLNMKAAEWSGFKGSKILQSPSVLSSGFITPSSSSTSLLHFPSNRSRSNAGSTLPNTPSKLFTSSRQVKLSSFDSNNNANDQRKTSAVAAAVDTNTQINETNTHNQENSQAVRLGFLKVDSTTSTPWGGAPDLPQLTSPNNHTTGSYNNIITSTTAKISSLLHTGQPFSSPSSSSKLLSLFLDRPDTTKVDSPQSSSQQKLKDFNSHPHLGSTVVVVQDKFIDTNEQMKAMLRKHSMASINIPITSTKAINTNNVLKINEQSIDSHPSSTSLALLATNNNPSDSLAARMKFNSAMQLSPIKSGSQGASPMMKRRHYSTTAATITAPETVNQFHLSQQSIRKINGASSNQEKRQSSVSPKKQQEQDASSPKKRKVQSSMNLELNLSPTAAATTASILLNIDDNLMNSVVGSRKIASSQQKSSSKHLSKQEQQSQFLERSMNQISEVLPLPLRLRQSLLMNYSPVSGTSSPQRITSQFEISPKKTIQFHKTSTVIEEDSDPSQLSPVRVSSRVDIQGILKRTGSATATPSKGILRFPSWSKLPSESKIPAPHNKFSKFQQENNNNEDSGIDSGGEVSINYRNDKSRERGDISSPPSSPTKKQRFDIEKQLLEQKIKSQRDHSQGVSDLISTIQNNAMENATSNHRMRQSSNFKLEKRKSRIIEETKVQRQQQFLQELEAAKAKNSYAGQEIELLEAEFASGGQFSSKNFNNLRVNRNTKRTKQQIRTIFRNTIKLLIRLDITPGEVMTSQIFSSKPFEKKNSRRMFEYLKANDVEQVTHYLRLDKYLVYDYDFLFMTPLHWACKRGLLKMVNVLLRYKADIDAEDMIGRTPLSFAVENDFEDIIEVLLLNKANPATTKYIDYFNLTQNFLVRKMLQISLKLHWQVKSGKIKSKGDQWQKEIGIISVIRQQHQLQSLKIQDQKKKQQQQGGEVAATIEAKKDNRRKSVAVDRSALN